LYKISKLDNPLCKNLQNIDRNKPVKFCWSGAFWLCFCL